MQTGHQALNFLSLKFLRCFVFTCCLKKESSKGPFHPLYKCDLFLLQHHPSVPSCSFFCTAAWTAERQKDCSHFTGMVACKWPFRSPWCFINELSWGAAISTQEGDLFPQRLGGAFFIDRLAQLMQIPWLLLLLKGHVCTDKGCHLTLESSRNQILSVNIANGRYMRYFTA